MLWSFIIGSNKVIYQYHAAYYMHRTDHQTQFGVIAIKISKFVGVIGTFGDIRTEKISGKKREISEVFSAISANSGSEWPPIYRSRALLAHIS